MKTALAICLALCLFTADLSGQDATSKDANELAITPMTFTTKDRQFAVEGLYLGSNRTHVRLRRSDNDQEVTVELSLLDAKTIKAISTRKSEQPNVASDQSSIERRITKYTQGYREFADICFEFDADYKKLRNDLDQDFQIKQGLAELGGEWLRNKPITLRKVFMWGSVNRASINEPYLYLGDESFTAITYPIHIPVISFSPPVGKMSQPGTLLVATTKLTFGRKDTSYRYISRDIGLPTLTSFKALKEMSVDVAKRHGFRTMGNGYSIGSGTTVELLPASDVELLPAIQRRFEELNAKILSKL